MTALAAERAPAVSRNSPCGCGSGKRYKACHGRSAEALGGDRDRLVATMLASLHAQRAGRLEIARDGYERVLADAPDTPDALNMLGVIDLAQGDPASALRRARRAVALFDGSYPDALHNLACIVAAWLVREATERSEATWLASRERSSSGWPAAGARISVVIPSHDHAAYIGEALRSAVEQSRPPDEIIVVDDGSTDGSVARIEAFARRHPGRVQVVAREGRGASATINEAVERSSGDWVGILNSDDRFAPDRLERMVGAMASGGGGWGFSRCRFIDDEGSAIESSARQNLDSHRTMVDGIGACDTVGFAFLSGNPAISTGTLHFARPLFDRVGGFRDLRYNHDWDFCLRATRHAEPLFVPAALYDYRVHGANTIHEAFERRKREADCMLADFYREAYEGVPPAHRFAPAPHAWGDLFLVRAIERGHATLLPPGTIEAAADRILASIGEDPDAG